MIWVDKVCRNLTDMSAFEFAGLKGLRRLSLVRVHKVTDIGIFSLAEHATALERLHLSYCGSLSLEAIHVLLKKLEFLQHLSATGVPSFRRRGVHRFSDAPPVVCPLLHAVSLLIYHICGRVMTPISKQRFVYSVVRTLLNCESFWIRRIDVGLMPKQRTFHLCLVRMIDSTFTRRSHA